MKYIGAHVSAAGGVENAPLRAHEIGATGFALFTKNPGFVSRAIRLIRKPANVQIVLSSLFMNKQARGNFPFVDKIFTVYDEQFIEKHGVQINCGARSCLGCQRCYLPNPNGEKVQQIREQVK